MADYKTSLKNALDGVRQGDTATPVAVEGTNPHAIYTGEDASPVGEGTQANSRLSLRI